MAINQVSTSNTFQEWLTATQQLISASDNLTEGGTVNTTSSIILRGTGQTLNVTNTGAITVLKSNTITANVLFLSEPFGVVLNVANSVYIGRDLTITNNLTVGNVTITGTQVLACTTFLAMSVTNIIQPAGASITQSDGTNIVFRISGNIQQLVANTSSFAGEVISTNIRNSLIASGNVVVSKNLSAGNINTSGNLVVLGNTFLGNGVHVVNFSNFDALRITNRGTGHSLLILDEPNDPSPLTITDGGVFVKGDVTPFSTRVSGVAVTPEIQQIGSVNANSSFASFTYSGLDASIAPQYLMSRARGTKTSPTIVLEGDVLGRISSAGYDGAKFVESSRIEFKIDPIAGASGVPSLNDMPGAISFLITDENDTIPTERLKVNTTHLWANTLNFDLRSLDSRVVLGSFQLGDKLITRRGPYFTDSRLKIKGEAYNDSTVSIFGFNSNNLNFPGFLFAKARGTEVAPLTVLDNDILGHISGLGYHANSNGATKFTEAARIDFQVDGTALANSLPGAINFYTSPGREVISTGPNADDNIVSPSIRMRIDANGNVGIGTLLSTSGLAIVRNDTSDALRVVQSGSGNVISAWDQTSDTSTFRIDNEGDAYFGRYITAISTNSLLTSKVGIFNYTPTIKTIGESAGSGIIGGYNYSTSNWPALLFGKARGTEDAPQTVQTGQVLGLISASGYTAESSLDVKHIEAARIQFNSEGRDPIANSVPGTIDFLTSPGGGDGTSIIVPTSRMKIDANGNVGIGTTTPLAGLHIFENSAIDGLRVIQAGSGNAFVVYDSVSDANPFRIDGAGNMYNGGTITSTGVVNINVSTAGGTAALSVLQRGTGPAFQVLDDFPDTTFFRIDASGNVGVGTGAPTARLHVYENSPNTAALITQVGSGDILVVNDSTFDETPSLRIDNKGDMYIAGGYGGSNLTIGNANNLTSKVETVVYDVPFRVTGSTIIDSSMLLGYKGNGGWPGIFFTSTRGTELAANSVINNSVLGIITAAGLQLDSEKNGMVEAARIQLNVDGNPSQNSVPGEITFYTSPGGPAPLNSVVDLVQRMIIRANGYVGIETATPSAKFHVYHNDYTPAFKVVQAGLGNAVEIFDTASDATPFIIDSTGNLFSSANLNLRASNNGLTGNTPINHIKFVDTDTTTVANQPIGKIDFRSNDANNPDVSAAYILARAVGTSGGANLVFAAASGSGNTEERLVISNSVITILGTANVSNSVRIGSTIRPTVRVYANGYGTGLGFNTELWVPELVARNPYFANNVFIGPPDSAVVGYANTIGTLSFINGPATSNAAALIKVTSVDSDPIDQTKARAFFEFITGSGLAAGDLGSPRFRISDNFTGVVSGILGYGQASCPTINQTISRTSTVSMASYATNIRLVSAAGTTSWTSFTVTNSQVGDDDVIIANQKSGTDLYEIHITNVTDGSFKVTFRTTGGTTTEQPVFKFMVLASTGRSLDA